MLTAHRIMDCPSFIQFYPSMRCNQRCRFCFNQNISDQSSYRDMTVKDAFFLCDMAAAKGISEIDILGGEPMLVPWIKDFIDHAAGSGISINISTNGSLPEAVSQLTEIRTQSLNIGFSVQGLEKTHNALTFSNNFSPAIAGITAAIAQGISPIVKSTVTPENMNEIEGLVTHLAEIGVKRYFLLHEDIIGRGRHAPCLSFPEFWKSFYILLIAFCIL